MIEKCNFKFDAFEMREGLKDDTEKYDGCALTMTFGNRRNECSGKENCILYMLYFLMNKVDYQTDPIAQKQLYDDPEVKKLMDKIKKDK